MSIFFTSDLHLGHTNIIRHANRPFETVEEMNEALVRNWNSMVTPEDSVIIVGDLAMNPKKAAPYVERMNGHKILLPGNHDDTWPVRSEGTRNKARRIYADMGVFAFQRTLTCYEIGKETVNVCHLPYKGDNKAEDRFPEYRPEDTGKWLIHGHMHDAWQVKDRMINVSVEMWDYFPVSVETIRAIIENEEVPGKGYPLEAPESLVEAF